MKIIIAPAKKMRTDTDSLPWRDLPVFLQRTQQLLDRLRGMTYEQLKTLWNCNDKIAAQNAERVAHMDLRENLTPALLAYDGIQYRYMAPGVFTDGEYGYVQEHLRILSGFYGILRPFDGVTPYRLEMQAKLRMGEAKDLYAFWGDAIARELTEGKTEPLEKVQAVYDFVVKNITYDHELAATVQSGYLPVLDTVLAKRSGICFDYASLMTGMLRSQGIPSKLVVGYAGTAYHAWISVWSEETGWVDGAIYFDGVSWQRMDPTFASSGRQSAAIMKYIGDGSNYTTKYLY